MAGEEWTVYAVMAAGILAGSIVKSITGFGSTIAHLCVWSVISALTNKPTGTLQQAVVCELVFRSVTAIPYLWMTNARQTANAKLVVSISLFQTIGSPLGAWLLTVLDQQLLELVLAASLLVVLIMQYLTTFCNSKRKKSTPDDQCAISWRKEDADCWQQQADLHEPLLPVSVAESNSVHKTAGGIQAVTFVEDDETLQQQPPAVVHAYRDSFSEVVPNPHNKLCVSESENVVSPQKPILFRSRSADLQHTATNLASVSFNGAASLPLQNGFNCQPDSNGPSELLRLPVSGTYGMQNPQWVPPLEGGEQLDHTRLVPIDQLAMDRQGCQVHAAHNAKNAVGTCKCTAEDLFWATPTAACSFLVGGKQQSYHCSICVADSIENAGDCEIICSHSYVTKELQQEAVQIAETTGKGKQHGWATILLAGSAAGTLSGVMGGLTGMDGPPTIFMFNAIGATKNTVRGTNAVINCILMTTLLTAYAYLGIFRASDWLLYTVSSISGMLGTIWGDHISSYMDQASFASMLNVMVLACALLEGASGLGLM